MSSFTGAPTQSNHANADGASTAADRRKMMSRDYRPLFTDIFAVELFDGRLEKFGVREHHNENTTETRRMLTDGRNYLWVDVEDGLVRCFTRYLGTGAPGKILQAIEDAFDVDIVSEHQPQYWGFDTQEEWEAAWQAIAKEQRERFHSEVLKFLKEEPHDIKTGTIEMEQAQIAKTLVEEDPKLLLPINNGKLWAAIQEAYKAGNMPTVPF